MTPANWKQNDDVIISPDLQGKKLDEAFPKGYKKFTDYLRYTPKP